MTENLYKIHFQHHKIDLYLSGRWTLANLSKIEGRLIKEFRIGLKKTGRKIEINVFGNELKAVDTSAVILLKKIEKLAFNKDNSVKIVLTGMSDEYLSLAKKLDTFDLSQKIISKPYFNFIPQTLSAIGKGAINALKTLAEIPQLFALFLLGFVDMIIHPLAFRFTSMFFHIQKMTISAMAIVASVSFMVGAVLTEQAAVRLPGFGAEELVVGFIGMVTARETSILLTGMLVAGRSSSSITAEIGSMRMNEEIDAMKVIGLDVMRFLVMPRVMAMLIALPILTFIAIVAGFAGSAVLLNIRYAMPIDIFIDRIYAGVEISDIGTSLVKTPFIAISMVMVACFEGMKVKTSAASLGHHTTVSVVKGLFLVIIIDSVIAIYFTQLNYGSW